ncbi:hypothetical protein JB92DRAFT_2818605 [Gautieria morchelliformis]|nr:hypothetical protein JB92DRAFT_2818605 [Gautieria morchelliformis]
MDLDGDAGDTAAFARFARGVEGLAGEEVVTIADIDDASRLREEDEVDTDEDQEEDGAFDAEERKEIGENGDVNSSGSSDEDTPRRSFQGRLQRIRAKADVKHVTYASSSSDEENGSDVESISKQGRSWADRDEDYIEHIEDVLDKNVHLLHGGDRKARNAFFKAAHTGEVEDDYEAFIPSNMRKKDRHIPPGLRDQWERDRAKKADRKRLRALARLQSAENASPTRRSSRRNEKILGGARVQGRTIYVDHVNTLGVLEELIRKFLGNLDMTQLVLPPKKKDWRRRAHLLAEAFNLMSKSTGKEQRRFMTLIKTTRSGININEKKIYRLVSGDNGEGFKASQGGAKPVRHRDGDEVGKMAPRLSDSNVGFRLLQQMGWEQGGRIGVTGGLADPLTAIVKTTKLGLGAAR